MANKNQYHPVVWELMTDVSDAFKAAGYASASGRLLDGVHKWLHYSGRHQPGALNNPWFTNVLALVWFARKAVEGQDGGQRVALRLDRWRDMAEQAWVLQDRTGAAALPKKVEPWKPDAPGAAGR